MPAAGNGAAGGGPTGGSAGGAAAAIGSPGVACPGAWDAQSVAGAPSQPMVLQPPFSAQHSL